MENPGKIRVWLLVGPALVLPAAFSWFYFVAVGARPEARSWYAAAKGFLLLWPLIARLLFLRPRQPAAGLPPARWRSALAGVAVGALVLACMAVAWSTPLGAGLRAGAGAIEAKLAQFGIGRSNYLAVAVGFSLLHSALEEYYWRWFVFGELRRILGGWSPHLLAAAGFALHHYVALGSYFGPLTAAWMGTLVGCGGLIWTAMYARWRSLAGPWISHVAIDLAIFWFGYRLLAGA